MLVGREAEQARVEALLSDARVGRSGALVLRGFAGIGKSALLDHALQHAALLTVVQVTAVESEAEIPFAGLDSLLRPLLVHLPRIPDVQAHALRGALALEIAAEVDRLAAYAGALSVLGEAADANPVFAVVDDAHWLDRATAECLAFVARRIRSEPLALLCAVREGEGADFGAGLPTLELGPLSEIASMRLLNERFGAQINLEVARTLAKATDGNPLGLLEIASLLTDGERAGLQPLPDHLPASQSVERSVRQKLRQLSRETRRALLIAAAADTSTGVDIVALEPAEDAALVRIHAGSITFRHPLVRSAIYQAASADERREAHRTLAAAFATDEDADRRAWHLAAAADESDETVAAALEAAAARFAQRGGHAVEARALERAAELSETDDTRAHRLDLAARAAYRAGNPSSALQLAEQGAAVARDVVVRARLAHLQWMVTAALGVPLNEREVVREAERVKDRDPVRAARLLHLLVFDEFAHLNLDGSLALVRRSLAICAAAGVPPPEETRSQLALMQLLLGDSDEANDYVRDCAHPVWATDVAIAVEQYDRARELLEAGLDSYGPTGFVLGLLHAKTALGELERRLGRFAAARAAATEGLNLAETTGYLLKIAENLGVLAWVAAAQGREREVYDYSARADETSHRARYALGTAVTAIARGLLGIGIGRPHDAIAHLQPVAERAAAAGLREPSALPYAADLIEAYARVGDCDRAAQNLVRLEMDAHATGRHSAHAAAVRLRGYVSPDTELDEHFGSALALHASTRGSAFELARTELLYGERLRRAKRKTEAREQLRTAVRRFDEVGAAPWAERARAELEATGERIARRDPTAPETLTAQELQIALRVAEGQSNREVAGALFLSHKTVEYHLTHIYRKLQLHSRAELIRLFAAETTPMHAAERSSA